MCGIAGFSLNPASKINARALGHHLLSSIEARGRHASGVAYHNRNDDRVYVTKAPIAGSNLQLKGMPRNTRTAIFHTRYATQGKPEINENNHPVWSPNKTLALVHNGVIWNDWQIRRGVLEGVSMPEVDTAVIPALLESRGIRGIEELAGDAAIAWLDSARPEILNLARIESSPVHYTNLEDGSFVFASTASLLMAPLDEMGLAYGEIFSMQELDYYKMKNGVIWNFSQTPEPSMYRTGVAASTRSATAGGHGAPQSTANKYGRGSLYQSGKPTVPLGATESKPKPGEVGSTFFGASFVAGSNGDVTKADSAEALADKWTEEDDKTLAEAMERLDLTPMFKSGDDVEPKYYTVDHEGSMTTYLDLDQLENALIYAAGRSEGEFGQGMSKWVNSFSDVGSFGFTDGELLSWVDAPSEIGYHEPLSDDGLSYVKDGVGILSNMKGR